MSYRKDIDGYEHREDEATIATEYKKYLNWIGIIKTMCDESHLVSKATGEPRDYEDEFEEYGVAMDIEEIWDETNTDHYLLDNGLHVYMKNGEVRIQDIDDFDVLFSMGFGNNMGTGSVMELSNNTISFFIGAHGPEIPYQISYSPENAMFGNLPVKGKLREQSNIRDILESELNFYLETYKDKPAPDNLWMKPSEVIEVFKSSIALYDKISDRVKTFQEQKSDRASDLQQRDAELASLEAEEKIIAEAEALIARQAEKSGEQK